MAPAIKARSGNSYQQWQSGSCSIARWRIKNEKYQWRKRNGNGIAPL
jgi:hypothetical protein